MLASVVLWAVPVMMDWLAAEDRDELTAELLKHVPDPIDTDAGSYVDLADNDPADKDLAGSRLAVGARHEDRRGV